MATIFEFDVVNTQVIAGQFSSTEQITVDWGDGGASSNYNGNDQSYSKDYGSAGNRTVTITASSEAVMTKFTMVTTGAVVSFALADLPSGVTYFRCTGSNTVSGSLSDLPSGLTYFNCQGSNTVSGSLSDLPSGVTYFYCTGSNTISGYTTRTWAASMNYINFVPTGSGGLTSAEIDQLLADLADTTWTSTKTITLTGTNAPRTTGSNADVATLTGLGVTTTTNTKLDAGCLYKITATEVDHFGTGLEVDDYFTADGTETIDANNKVKQVLTPSATGVTIVSAAFGETYNFKTVETGFDFADTYTYYLIESASGFINYNSMAWMEAHGVSKTIVESGYFQPSNTIDLTEVYTSRISASITSQTIDLVSSDLWEIDDLYAVPDLYFDIRSGAEVWLAVSITNDDPSGNPSWSDWKRFVIGDYTARAFRFRIYGSGTLPFTTPVISEVTITIDMPDRIVSFSGNVEIGGSNITFDAPFAIVPKIGIAIQDGSEGDTYTIENLDESGFDIYIYNGGIGVARSITGVAQGYGKKATTN